MLTALHRRGSIPAQLGQQFIIPDPFHSGRIAVLAGMGKPGFFRAHELTFAVRELIWTLGRLHRRHPASVIIGAGIGNITIALAVRAWLRGLRQALFDAQATDVPRIKRLTFVEYSAANFVLLHQALAEESRCISLDADPLQVAYSAPTSQELAIAKANAEHQGVERARLIIRSKLSGIAASLVQEPEPIRFTVGLSNNTYWFSVLSSEASIPQRNTTVDAGLIEAINNQLVLAPSFARQRDLGHLLGRILVPADLQREVVRPGVPTVLTVDASTARIHFELVARYAAAGREEFDPDAFVGTAASLTRQLRTTFAPLPVPPLLAGRALRVLVIADTCEEAPLPGAQEEGETVAQLFEQFAASGANVEVLRLLGPAEATRLDVLDCLINQRFDLVHYTGHYFFNEMDPPRSGWLFSGNEVLSVSELERAPRFIFSNAYESGLTPDRADKRHADFAPSFAEALFALGAGNLICAAWPVVDSAARVFATRVYRGLLGLLPVAEPLHEAIKAARIETANMGEGGRSAWGAFQHYGDPYFRIRFAKPDTAPSATSGRARPKPRSRRRR